MRPLYPIYAKDSTESAKFIQLKQKLGKLKIRSNADILERISKNLNLVNEKRVGRMEVSLEKFSSLLTKIEDQVNIAQNSGMDVIKAKSAISDTRVLLRITTEAIKNQKEKDYTIEFSGEQNLASQIKPTRDKLFSDLKKEREMLINFQQSLVNAKKVTLEILEQENEK